jgi:hypothetical protein
MIPTPHRPPEQIQRELTQAQKEQQSLQPLPSPSSTERLIAELTARQAVAETDAARDSLRADLHEQIVKLDAIRQDWQRNAQINTSIQSLTRELAESTAARRMEAITAADQSLERAIQRYQTLAVETARAWREMQSVAARNSHIPGAFHLISRDGFDFEFLRPMSWQGPLSSIMKQGQAPFETPEREAA